MKLIVLTQDTDSKKEIEYCNTMLDAGLQTLHIRKPGYKRQEMEDFIRAIASRHHKKLVLHSHYSLAVKYRLKGIHLTQKCRKSPIRFLYSYGLIYKLRRPKMSISASFHDVYELLNVPSGRYSYTFLSPIFKSISKDEYKPHYSLGRLQDKLRCAKVNVYALGGIDEHQLITCQSVGFIGIAILGAIWKNECPVCKFNHIYQLCLNHLMPLSS